MKTLIPIVLIILGILYVITPYNLLPSVIPVIGWIDDIAVTALMIYYMRYGRLPDFINRFLGRMTGGGRANAGGNARGGAGGQHDDRQWQTGGAYGGGKTNPYNVLGVSPGASRQEIHEAYRKLAQQYHPDKVSHLGPEIQETAKRKFIEIQQAYEQLKGGL